MANDIVLTKNGYEKLKKELEELKGPTRMLVAQAIREAKAHGDLRENAAYHEAKLNQTRLDGRIADLEKVLTMAKVVERQSNGETAGLGSKVRVKDLKWDEEIAITLVGSYEADMNDDLVSITSPLGSALLGKSAGEELDVEAPAGKQRYRVLDVSD